MSIQAILWDMDGTILNFKRAESAAIKKGFNTLRLGQCTDEMIEDYSEINTRYWKMLERGEMTKPEILIGRFEEFFSKYGVPIDRVAEFNANYQIDLGDTICFNDDAPAVLEKAGEKVRQFIVSNGTKIAQSRKIERADLRKYMDGIFISDEIGCEKPGMGFFEPVLEAVRARCADIRTEEILIVGDSLTSDMQGGNNAGIKCCWYNPYGEKNTNGVRIDYEIKNLKEVLLLLAE